jgi:outer membrane lipoprotein SlyB
MFAMLAVMIPAAGATTANAQSRYYRQSNVQSVQYRRPSFYRRHRHLSNILIGTGAGALVGGLIGGRRGVGIGMLAGGGAGALYTYKLNPKKNRYYRSNRRY